MLNKSKGNMYPFVTHTWNTIKGKCPHDCVYCYMKIYKQPELHFDEKELKTDLGSGNFIFVGSSCDMWADDISIWLISQIISHCKRFDNRYLFQSKNPFRFKSIGKFPSKTILGVTIETNREYSDISKAPYLWTRYADFLQLDLPKMVSIEPIMDFDLDVLVQWIKDINPEFVSIGADSKRHNLPEPDGDKVRQLISALQESTVVKIKKNLGRLY